MLNRAEEVSQVRMFYSKIKKEGTIKVVLLGGLNLVRQLYGWKIWEFHDRNYLISLAKELKGAWAT